MRHAIMVIAIISSILAVSVSRAEPEVDVNPDELYELIEQADRVVVSTYAPDMDRVVTNSINGVEYKAHPTVKKVLYESRDRKDLDALRDSLNLAIPDRWFHCMCLGKPEIILYLGEVELTSFTNHHGMSIRSPLWSGDVPVADTDKWVSWFAERGVMGPLKEVEDDKARMEQSRIDTERWMEAMPGCIKPLWKDAYNQSTGLVETSGMKEALAIEYPEQSKRILVLLGWYGSGAGPWSGYPSYESAPEDMLLEYKTGDIINAIESNELTEAQTEGAARYFGGWDFLKKRGDERVLIPGHLKKKLLDHVLAQDDEDKKARATNAFN